MASSLFGQQQSQNLQTNDGNNNILELLKSSKNPDTALSLLAKQNPQIQNVINYASQYKTPKDAFYALAKERGIDPDLILNAMR